MTAPHIDKGWSRKTPPLQERRVGHAPGMPWTARGAVHPALGKGWGLSVEKLAELHRRATEMRNNPTEPEKRLWRHLSNRKLEGAKFRRQSVIGWFIADFLCSEYSLIVEVDGDSHDEAKDQVRDDILGKRGFRVIRVTNDDVMTNMDGVLMLIAGAVAARCARYDMPHPNPVPGRSGSQPDLNRAGRGSPGAPQGEGLEKAETQKLRGISLEGSVG